MRRGRRKIRGENRGGTKYQWKEPKSYTNSNGIPEKLERAAVEATVAPREEITPEHLRILEDTVDRAAQLDADCWRSFRETRAYPLVVRFASLPADLLDFLCGDFITEDLGHVLASVCGGDLAGIQFLVENEATDEWVWGAALRSRCDIGRRRTKEPG